MLNVLGVHISTYTKQEILDRVMRFFSGTGQRMIFTPNPEMIVKAQKDLYFREVLNKGDVNVCDGFGLLLAAKLKAKKEKLKIERVTGVDLLVEICRLAEQEERSVFLLGSGSDEVVRKTAERLQTMFPKLKIVGCDAGVAISENFQFSISNFQSINNVTIQQFNNDSGLNLNKAENDGLVEKINQAKPDILFVAFGMGKQEKWIYENLVHMPSVKVAMGVGGSFEYISGTVPRAPLLMRKIGLEWLYRLVRQPQRIGRILNATFKFIWLLLNTRY